MSALLAGWKWLFNVARLVVYAMLLLPGFLQVSRTHCLARPCAEGLPPVATMRQTLQARLCWHVVQVAYEACSCSRQRHALARNTLCR